MARVMAARRVWDLAIGKTKTTLRGVAVTPDGSRVVSASEDSTLRVWDLEFPSG
jgi:WD40 repeat protein